MTIRPEQRFSKRHPCPICGGGHDLPQGKNVRCTGFISKDGQMAFCTREEYAGDLVAKQTATGASYRHRLVGPCKCGSGHAAMQAVALSVVGNPQESLTFRSPIPDYAPPPPFLQRPRPHQRPPVAYRYTDAAGRPLFFVVRREWVENGTRRKVLVPWTCWERTDGALTWKRQGPPQELARPLFNLEGLAERRDAPVLVVEGEKTSCAAGSRFRSYVSTTWHGGAASVHLTDFRPLKGRVVVIWPDADAAGLKAAEAFARAALLAGAACVRIVTLPADLPQGWDLGDATPDGLTDEALEALMRDAPDWAVTPQDEPHVEETDAPSMPQPLDGYRLEDEDLSEMGMAIRFARVHQGRVLFCPSKGFLSWDGVRFVEGEHRVQELVTAQIVDLRREAAGLRREAGKLRAESALAGEVGATGALTARAKELDAKAKALCKAAKELGKSPKLQDIMRQVASKPGIYTDASAFDADPFLLNVRNGVVDLRTGLLHPHAPSYRMTKLAGTLFVPGALAPTWESFIHDAFGGDQDLIRFVRQIIGYALTGDTREQKFFIFEGTGGNGKGVFLDPVIVLFGDYAVVVRKEMVTLAYNGDSQAGDDLVRLHTARLASINELSAGDRLNVSRVKEVSGGEEIAARPLFKMAFSYQPGFKMFIRTNHLPEAKVDEALADRLVRVPFKVKFRGTKKDDKTLKARILTELPGILNWALVGLQDWRQHGLTLPRAVAMANAEYVAEQDPIGRWIAQLDIRPVMEAGRLHEAYTAWCRREGVQTMSPESFGKALSAKGWGTDNRRIVSGGKKVRVRIAPAGLLEELPVQASQAGEVQMVLPPGLGQAGTLGTDFPLGQLDVMNEEMVMGDLGEDAVPMCPNRPADTWGVPAVVGGTFEEGEL